MMLKTEVTAFLDELKIKYDAIACDPSLADTADFCSHYGYSPDDSANALLVASSKGEPKSSLCVLLANTRLDVNRVVRKKLGVRRLSFASPEVTQEVTGMELGGVTPFAMPPSLPIWVDAAVMQRERIVLGGGNRSSKIVLEPDQLLKVPALEVVQGLANPV